MYRHFYALLCFVAMGSPLCGQTLDSVRSALAEKKYDQVITGASGLISSSAAETRAEAAVLLLQAFSAAKDHAQLEAHFKECVDAAAGTPFEAKCYLERAKSAETNTKNLSSASDLYEEILQKFPTDEFVAPAALLQQGGIDIALLRPEKAKRSYSTIIQKFFSSPFADDAYVGLAKVEAAELNPTGISEVIAQMERHFPNSPVLSQALLAQADFANAVSGDKEAAFKAYQKLIKLGPHSMGAVTARVRLADSIFKRDFFQGKLQYEAILAEHPRLSVGVRDWINSQLGIYYWQIGQQDSALTYFDKVKTNSKLNTSAKRTAALHKRAFASPNGIEMFIAVYDKGLRWRESDNSRDLCWQAFAQVRELSKQSAFTHFVEDSSKAPDERAEMWYRMAIVEFELGDHDAVAEYAQKALELGPTGLVKYQAKFVEAYHHGHCGHHEHAINIYREILDDSPKHASLTPAVYMELVKEYQRSRDDLGVLLTCEEFSVLYPYRKENNLFSGEQARLKLKGEELAERFEIARKQMLARIKNKQAPLKLLGASEASSNKIILSMGVEK